ncbi:hypothetical protein M413DRAFT_448189 [Hebeloma cylindrosporum]|uniref:WW domain-containing protein n=1 Tax=Hebeloma cylindrosporum TaxID=76867 RepID=A0A0C3BMK9_HEBCY|nr:hypothetical protein M413DRAFT_448189 [Hebeloma cylindrosporum h7]
MSSSHSNPKDWKIIETSSGGLERDFYNEKTGESTWYTPEGMSASDILAIPDAKKYWSTVEQVELYIREMAAQKAKYGGKDVKDQLEAKRKA